MARVIIVKEFTEEVKAKLLAEIERLNEPLLYATDNKTYCVVKLKGKSISSRIKVIKLSIWYEYVNPSQLESAEVWEQ